MTDTDHATDETTQRPEDATLDATRYADGTVTYPGHTRGPNGAEPVGTVDLSDCSATVITFTTSMATPPGVREPNTIGIVEFDLDTVDVPASETVRALGQFTTDEVAIGDTVRPVYCPELRDPDAGIREPESQDWDGFRFEPVE